ncbi:sulfatase-like hydrolase/transferase [Engelhardtia mirabilis]|uniref:Sulfatase n=1 Tax=Engelhardtia mirabilis TaxID=2528011 RepID=A0A518BM20_9BACT|nr:Sulfatase [Planctomycetes bacterium Pla133]QDV02346.1 Sulfatase [Planctomycetes bacterium Pla86]
MDEERAGTERLARFALAALVLIFPLVYLVKVVTGERVPVPQRADPAWIHLVLITVGDWSQPTFEPESPALVQMLQRGVFVGPIYSASDDPGASAASLWTGRYPANSGVQSSSQALPFGAWTLAEGARRSGYRTAAFLQQPFATRQNIGGFDQVIEGESLDVERLSQLADSFLRQHPDQRRLLWLHLERAGRDLADVDALLGAVQATLADTGDEVDTLTMVTGLTGSPRGWMEARCRVPLMMELPTQLSARSRSSSHLSLVDATGLLRLLMRLPNPDAGAGESALQSRGETLWNAVKGVEVFEWVWIEGEFGHVMRRPGLRVQVDPAPPDQVPTRDLRILNGTQASGQSMPHLSPADERGALEAYLSVRKQVYEGATEPIDALGG